MGAIKDIIDIIKELRDMAREASNQPMIDLAVKIQDEIFDMKNILEELRDENRKLKKEIDTYKDARKIEKHIVPLREPLFQLDTDVQKSFYCQHCWEKDKKLFKVNTYYYGGNPYFKCNNCGNTGYTNCEIK